MKTTLPEYCWMAVQASLEKKAERVLVLDVRQLCDYAHYIMVCHGEVQPHVQAIVDHLRETLEPRLRLHHVEGYEAARWVVLDYTDFIIHVFDEDTRFYYNIEDLWVEAPHWWFRADGTPVVLPPPEELEGAPEAVPTARQGGSKTQE